MAMTDAQRRAKNKYDAKTYENLQIKTRKEEAANIRAHAENQGESLTRFIVRAAYNQMELDMADRAFTLPTKHDGNA